MKTWTNLAFLFLILTGCARTGAPGGGEKDTTPPVLVSAAPAQGTINFSSREIVLTFNEYVKLNNVQQQLLISPPLEEMPEFRIKRKSIIIELKSDLQPNTTYNFNFGDAIVDVNEDNVLKNFSYVFSTGSFIDTLSISGAVTDAFTGLPKTEVSVFLYKDFADSVPYKSKPFYAARAEAEGIFRARNIKEGYYKVVAVHDKNKNLLLDKNEDLAFAGDIVAADTNPAQLQLKSFTPMPSEVKVVSKKLEDDRMLLAGLSAPCPDCRFEEPEGQQSMLVSWKDKEADSLFAWVRFQPGQFTYFIKNDTGTIDTLTFVPRDNKKPVNVKLEPLFGQTADPLVPLQFKATEPLDTTAIAEVIVTGNDSVARRYRLVPDSVVPHQYTLRFTPGFAQKYEVIIPDSTLKGIYGGIVAGDTLAIETYKTDFYGNLVINMDYDLPDPGILVLREGQHGREKRTSLRPGKSKIEFMQLLPAQYKLFIIVDKNANGKWDTGHYDLRQQPEPVLHYKDLIGVRSNWDLEIDWKVQQ